MTSRPARITGPFTMTDPIRGQQDQSPKNQLAANTEIIAGICDAMSKEGLDAVITISPENFAYVNGFVVPSQPIMRWRHALTIIRTDGNRAILVVDMEESTVRSKIPEVDLRVWGEFTDKPMQVLSTLLSDMGLVKSKLGLELDYLSASDFNSLSVCLPDTQFTAADELLARQRQIKTVAEIEKLRNLSLIADRSILDSLQQVSTGDTEMDIAAALTKGVYAMGADSFKLMIVATGKRSVFPNVGPSPRQLRTEDVCRVEIFAVRDGYQAGVCRTAVVGGAPREAERIWQHLVECKYMVMDMIKPGASSRAIYDAFTMHMKKLDLAPISFVGHGIGLQLHEKPYLSRYSDVPLEAGMVLGIEPLVYDTGFGFGMQNKDMFLVTESGCELLSNHTDTDQLIVIS